MQEKYAKKSLIMMARTVLMSCSNIRSSVGRLIKMASLARESAQAKSRSASKTVLKNLKHSITKKKQEKFFKTLTLISCSTRQIVLASVTPNHLMRDESRQREAKK